MGKVWKSSEDLLELCLSAIQQKGHSIDECLVLYPEQREELEPLLRTAVRLEAARTLSAPAQFKSMALQRLQAGTAVKPHPRKSRWSLFMAAINAEKKGNLGRSFTSRTFGYLLVGLLLVVLIAAGVATFGVSAQAMPGDFLYPVKRAQEELQLNLTRNEADQADLHLTFASRRLTEAITLIEQESTISLNQTLSDYDRHMQAELVFISPGSSLTPSQRSNLADKLLPEVTRYETNLTALIPETPASAQTNLEAALATSRKAYNQAVEVITNQNGNTFPTPILAPKPSSTPVLAPTPSSTPLPAIKPPTSTRLPTRNVPSISITSSRQPSFGNLPTATSTKSPVVRPTKTPPPIKEIPTNTVPRTPSTNSLSAATATRPPIENGIKPTATSRAVPDPVNITSTLTILNH